MELIVHQSIIYIYIYTCIYIYILDRSNICFYMHGYGHVPRLQRTSFSVAGLTDKSVSATYWRQKLRAELKIRRL